jgi:hypothetical protein
MQFEIYRDNGGHARRAAADVRLPAGSAGGAEET